MTDSEFFTKQAEEALEYRDREDRAQVYALLAIAAAIREAADDDGLLEER